MFEIAINKDGVACIVTDNPTIADAIHSADEDNKVPVWFTGAPNLKTARELAKGMTLEFGRKAAVGRFGSSGFSAFFIEPETESPWERIAKLNGWLSEHESMLAKARGELNNANRSLLRQRQDRGIVVQTRLGPYTYSPDGADPAKSAWPFKVKGG